jgi:catechol 2,3-dioxygenase-like lactoylglutathione lyase family enzyme
MTFEHQALDGPGADDVAALANHSAPIWRLDVGFAVERFDHIVLNCNDVDATAAWYERVLGMTRANFGPSNRIALSFGNQKINLRPVGALADDPEWVTGIVEAAGSEDLCFITEAAPDEVRAHLEDCGVEVTAGPVTKTGAMGAMTSHYCRDIDGNLVEIAVY